jgi:hypothetical protein
VIRPLPIPAVTILALAFCFRAGPGPAAEAEKPVLAQDLKKLRVEGKVASVLWTRREDRYTLQVVFPRSTRVRMVGERIAGRGMEDKAGKDPDIQVWLLKADGALIPAGRRTLIASVNSPRHVPDEVLYASSLSAGREAVAVALSIDNEFYIQELEPFDAKKK